MIYNDPLLVIQEALYCGDYCDLTKEDKEYHSSIIQYSYPIRVVELLKYSYEFYCVEVAAIVELNDGSIVGVIAQVYNHPGTHWEPPDYTTDYEEVDAEELRQEIETLLGVKASCYE